MGLRLPPKGGARSRTSSEPPPSGRSGSGRTPPRRPESHLNRGRPSRWSKHENTKTSVSTSRWQSRQASAMLSTSRLPPLACGTRRWIFSRARRVPQTSHIPPERCSTVAFTRRGMCRLRSPVPVGARRRRGNGLTRGSLVPSQSVTKRRNTSPSDTNRGRPLDISSRARRKPSFAPLVTRNRIGKVGSPWRASSTARSASSRSGPGATVSAFFTQASFAADPSSIAGSAKTRPTETALSAATSPRRTFDSSEGAAARDRPSASRRWTCWGPNPTAAAQR